MSRYKLLGEIWDKSITKKINIKKDENISEILNYDKDYNLFDYKQYNRKIKLSTLFDVKNQKDLNDIINKVQECDTLYVELDLKPMIDNEIVKSFYEKRLKQINYNLHNSLKKDCKIYFIDAKTGC